MTTKLKGNFHVRPVNIFLIFNTALCSAFFKMTLINKRQSHNCDVIMGAMASKITSFTIVYSIVYSDADQGKHQSSASLAFVRGIRRWPVNSPHKWSVTRKMFPFDDVIMSRARDVFPQLQLGTKLWVLSCLQSIQLQPNLAIADWTHPIISKRWSCVTMWSN